MWALRNPAQSWRGRRAECWDGNGVNIMTSEISSRPAVFRSAHQRGEKLVLSLSLSLWYFITKITDTGRKPSPGEFVMIIRLGNISGLGTSPLSSPAWQSFTFLTEVEIDQTLAGWCDGVLVLTVTTPLTTSLTLTRLPCSTEPSFLSTCDVTRATRQLSPHQQPHWSSPLQGLQTTLHTPF